MLFKSEWVEAVLTGRKRQTIRVKQPRLTVGRSYAVQTSFRSKSLGRVRVTAVRRCTLAELSGADIVAQGWKASQRDDFERYFAEVNHFGPQSMSPSAWKRLRARPFWCIDFEPAE